MSNALPRWYDREHMPYQQDIRVANEYANWLQQIPWQLFATFTFAKKVSDYQAVAIFDTFINRLERDLCSGITYIRGDEKRFSGCGKPACPRHFHVVLAAVHKLDAKNIADRWTKLAGKRSEGESAKVDPYNPKENGIAYLLKMMNQPEGNWAEHNLKYYLPSSEMLFSYRSRRRLLRHLQRVQQHSQGL